MSDDERTRLHFRFKRSLVGSGDPSHADFQWLWCRNDADSRVLLSGAVGDNLVLFRARDVLSASLVDAVELGRESLLVAAQRTVGDAAMLGRFRLGERLVDTPQGTRRAACILQLWPDSTAWRAEVRRFGTTADGLGVWHGDWQEHQGDSPQDAPDWLLEWVDIDKARVLDQEMGTQQGEPGLELRTGLFPAPESLPDDPRGLAAALHHNLDQEIARQGLDCVLVFIFRPDLLERWEIRRTGPFPLDDVVRAACATGDLPLAVAMVHPGSVSMPDGRTLPGILTVVHKDGQLGRRGVPVEQRADGLRLLSPYFPPLEEITDPWIGEEPRVPLKLTLPTAGGVEA